jgi:hypothetical protein
MRNTHRIVVVKAGRKRPFGRHRCKWEDNIRINLRKYGWKAVDWIHQA